MTTKDTEDTIWQLLAEANELPHGDAKATLVEDAVRRADAAELEQPAFTARMALIQAYGWGGHDAKMFVPFARCLADYDRNPNGHEPWVQNQLWWFFKHVISSMTSFPTISLAQTERALEDMARRYTETGNSPRPVHQHRHYVASHLGDREAADRWFDEWLAAPRDELADCDGCEPSEQARYLAEVGRHADAIATAAPILDEELTCSEQPQSILTNVLLPFTHTGDLDRARSAHRRAYRILRTRPQDLSLMSTHLVFCARTGNEARGMELLERHLGWLDRAPSPSDEMWFTASAALLLRRVGELGESGLPVIRPAHGDRPAIEHTVSELADQLRAQARQIAGQFDQRNGTGHQSQCIEDLLAAELITGHLPLSVTPPRPTSIPETAAPELPDLADKTLPELVDAAEESLARSEIPVTEATLSQAEQLVGAADDPILRGRVIELRGRLSDDAKDFRQATELYAAAGDEGRRQYVLGRLGELLCRQGQYDEGLSQMHDAAAYFEREDDAGRAAYTLLRLARVHGQSGDHDTAKQHWDRAADLARHATDPVLTATVTWTRMHLPHDNHDALTETVTSAVAALREAGMRHLAAVATSNLADLRLSTGEPEDARKLADDALTQLPADMAGPRMSALETRAKALSMTDRGAESIPVWLEALGIASELSDESSLAALRYGLAIAYRRNGQHQDAVDMAEDALIAFVALDDHEAANQARYVLANMHAELNEPDQALIRYEEMTQVQREHGMAGAAQILAEMADLLYEQDRDAQAAERYLAAATAATAEDDDLRAAYCLGRAAESHWWSGDRDAAQSTLARARTAVESLPDDEPAPKTWHRAQLAGSAARILRGLERLDDAIAEAERAVELFEEIGEEERAVGGRLTLGQLLIEADRPADAEPVLRAAHEAVISHGEPSPPIANALAVALERLDRSGEAAEIRTAAGLD